MQRTYIWERPDWPHFHWKAEELLLPHGAARREQGSLLGMMSGAGFYEQQLVDLEARTEEATGTSEIEGEPVSKVAVRSSIARRLHIETATLDVHDPRAQGLVDMTLDATLHWNETLTADRLHQWHRWLLPYSDGRRPITVGAFRDDSEGPMQVVSGRVNAPIVHFEAPPADRVSAEVDTFLTWFNAPSTQDGLIVSAIAHLWFVTIHPYDDGNGRIARAVADLALARDESSGRRFFSMSREINQTKDRYHEVLERTQYGDLDVTEWLLWFLDSYVRAIARARGVAEEVLRSDAFWRKHSNVVF